MKLFRFHNPLDFRFARGGRLGTWCPDPGPGVCPECTASRQRRVPPLIMEWLPESDTIGDFVWPGGDVVVSQRVREALEERFQGFEFKPVEMWQDPKLKRPQRITKRTKPRVWLPHEGPPLYELWVTAWVHADPERSTIRLTRDCATCGRRAYEMEGVEVRKSRWDAIKRDLVEVHIPRQAGKGIYVHQEDLRSVNIFRLFEAPGWILCTERVKTLIEDRAFSNVAFLEVGDVLRSPSDRGGSG